MPFDPSSATPLDAPSAPAPAGFDPSSARIFDPSTATAAPEAAPHAGGWSLFGDKVAPVGLSQLVTQETGAAPPRAGAADVGHGIGAGLMRGAGAVLGMPSDLWQMLDRGYQNLLTRSAEKMGILTPEQGAKLRQPIPGAEDYEAGSTKINQHLMDLAAKAGADTSEPTTKAGQVAENVASFLPGAVSLGAGSVKEIPRAAVRYGLLPGAASELAGQATQGTAAEPYARLAGALGPEALIQGSRLATRAMDPMRGLIEGASPQQLQTAQRILEESRAAGAPLTVPEAIQTATGNGTRVGDLQRVVEQSERGAETMRPFMAQRPGQTEALGRGVLNEVSPTAGNPYELPARVQGAADQTVQGAAAARTQAVNPFYERAATDQVPGMEDFLARVDNMIAGDKTGILAPKLEQLRNSLTMEGPLGAEPITDIANLDRARKFFRDRMALPAWAQEAIPKEEGAKIGSLLDDLRQRMISASPDFAAGKNLYQDITENTFNPLQRSPTGQLAGAETFPKQAQILFNPNPLPGSESAVGKAVRDVAKVEPETAAQMVRMHLERTFNEATQNNLPGANQFGGPKFAAVVAGNSQQAKNLEAAVRALPNGDLRWNALRKGLDIMEAMGTRQPVGSQTSFNNLIQKHLQQGNPASEFLVQAASPGRWPGLVDRIYRHVVFNRNTGELARLFTTGNVKDLQAIASSGQSTRGQMALIGALGRQGFLSTPQNGSPPQ